MDYTNVPRGEGLFGAGHHARYVLWHKHLGVGQRAHNVHKSAAVGLQRLAGATADRAQHARRVDDIQPASHALPGGVAAGGGHGTITRLMHGHVTRRTRQHWVLGGSQRQGR